MAAHGLSKSRIIEGRQCPRRLWLKVYRPEVGEWETGTRNLLQAGLDVHEVFRGLHPGGVLIDTDDDLAAALAETGRHLAGGAGTLFEATFAHQGVLVRADFLERRSSRCRVHEVKSSTGVKDVHLDDAAIQHWVLAGCGLDLEATCVTHIDNRFVYQGNRDYHGLFADADVSGQVAALLPEVPAWVEACRVILAGSEPAIPADVDCESPWACPFAGYCFPAGPEVPFPIETLPGSTAEVERLKAAGFTSIRQVPRDLLRLGRHLRMWQAVHDGAAVVDPELPRTLRDLPFPRFFLDFETIQFAVPIWVGTRPYEQLPFQFSCHVEWAGGRLEHREFLDLGGGSPLRPFAERLLETLGTAGPIVTYGPFERRILRESGERFPDLQPALEALKGRVVDLLSLLRRWYYHPAMAGSWSIKNVLPAIAPELRYETLQEVRDGGAAQAAFLEAIHPGTAAPRRDALRRHLLAYCARDTLGLVTIVRHFA
ncbi:MAG: DUF2779 domain-containing protein [Candidatus Riflebacteria bacterium]|nr:DUF2779 domain-containing protein [Candidatus Riflebacteria bacterium]